MADPVRCSFNFATASIGCLVAQLLNAGALRASFGNTSAHPPQHGEEKKFSPTITISGKTASVSFPHLGHSCNATLSVVCPRESSRHNVTSISRRGMSWRRAIWAEPECKISICNFVVKQLLTGYVLCLLRGLHDDIAQSLTVKLI